MGVLRTLVEGVREEPVELVVTVGRDLDPAALGPQPAHVHVERYIPGLPRAVELLERLAAEKTPRLQS